MRRNVLTLTVSQADSGAGRPSGQRPFDEAPEQDESVVL